MQHLKTITNSIPEVAAKVNYFINVFNHFVNYAGTEWHLELETPLSLLEKVLYQLKQNQRHNIVYLENYFANELSPNYFDDLIKKETGSTALYYIQTKIIDQAKTFIFDRSKTFNEIASDLGFKYQQHFTRLFKQKTGLTPQEYRGLN